MTTPTTIDLTNLNLNVNRQNISDTSSNLENMITSQTCPKCEFSNPCVINNGSCPFGVISCPSQPKRISRTLINSKQTWIYSRGITHSLGEMNGCPDNWWILLEFHTGEYQWVPWIDLGTNRICWEMNIKQDNRIKYSWGEYVVRSTGLVTMKCNGQIVYEFGYNDIDYGISKAQYLRFKMQEHPFNFMNPEEEIGRRIWYKRQPAIISKLLLNQGCIFVKYCGIGAGFDIIDPWITDSDVDSYLEYNGDVDLKVDVFSNDIYWFRDEGQGESENNDLI